MDLGCGWGGLILYAAQNYGVDATGITLSEPQASLANERIVQAGMTEHCRVLVADYRELNDADAYDKIASVGMFEHVGEALLPEYFSRAYHLLKPGGVFLNHGIALGLVDPIPDNGASTGLKARHGPGTEDSFINNMSSQTVNWCQFIPRCGLPRKQASRCGTWNACASITC